MNTQEPEFQDDVKHKTSDVAGTVIAKYNLFDGANLPQPMLDVRSNDERIYYGTPAKDWTVIRTRVEKEGPDVTEG